MIAALIARRWSTYWISTLFRGTGEIAQPKRQGGISEGRLPQLRLVGRRPLVQNLDNPSTAIPPSPLAIRQGAVLMPVLAVRG